MAHLPVPTDSAAAYRAGARRCRNFGLLFDRFVPYGVGWVMEGSDKSEAASKLVETVNGWRSDSRYKELFSHIQKRQRALIASQNGRSFTAQPEWRLVVGLGRDSAFETGMTLHRIYGCPYIPGSALKGMTLAWVKAMKEQENILAETITTIFGTDDSNNPKSGSIVFFDALPITPPTLELDIMNPHYPDYYKPSGQEAYPTDWQSPIPIYFITVASTTKFLFGLSARNGNNEHINTVRRWLQNALENMGVGGKTTSGYGYWQIV